MKHVLGGCLCCSQPLIHTGSHLSDACRGMKHVLGGCLCGDADNLVLEDNGGRMALRGDCLPVHELVTGE